MNKRSRPKLSESDLELFNRVVADVKPLKFQDKSVINKKNSINKIDKLKKTNMTSREIKLINQATSISNAPIVIGDHSPGRAPGIDRKTSLKLKKGKIEINYKLDLHGLTQIEAKQALEEAIKRAWKQRLRLILVITGKGLRQPKNDGFNDNVGTGVLRRTVPNWLKETPLSNFVLAFSSAQQTHGGTGALYVLLRRQIDNRDKV
jgi:DNA-nicking Smr family endonuclease